MNHETLFWVTVDVNVLSMLLNLFALCLNIRSMRHYRSRLEEWGNVTWVTTPEHLKGSIYDQDGVTAMIATRGRGPKINVKK